MGLQGQPFRNKFQGHFSQPVGINSSDMPSENDENEHHSTAGLQISPHPMTDDNARGRIRMTL